MDIYSGVLFLRLLPTNICGTCVLSNMMLTVKKYRIIIIIIIFIAYDIILNLSSGIFLNFVSFHWVVFYASDASFCRKGGKGRSQDPDLMNKKSLWLKGDWFVSSWVAYYSALERRGVLIDKSPPLPPWRLWPQSHQVQYTAP